MRVYEKRERGLFAVLILGAFIGVLVAATWGDYFLANQPIIWFLLAEIGATIGVFIYAWFFKEELPAMLHEHVRSFAGTLAGCIVLNLVGRFGAAKVGWIFLSSRHVLNIDSPAALVSFAAPCVLVSCMLFSHMRHKAPYENQLEMF